MQRKHSGIARGAHGNGGARAEAVVRVGEGWAWERACEGWAREC